MTKKSILKKQNTLYKCKVKVDKTKGQFKDFRQVDQNKRLNQILFRLVLKDLINKVQSKLKTLSQLNNLESTKLCKKQ